MGKQIVAHRRRCEPKQETLVSSSALMLTNWAERPRGCPLQVERDVLVKGATGVAALLASPGEADGRLNVILVLDDVGLGAEIGAEDESPKTASGTLLGPTVGGLP